MPGFSSVTGLPSYVYAENASFDGTQRGGGLVNNGQLWIGAGTLPNVRTGFIASQLAGSTAVGTVINGAGTITYEDRSWLTRYVVDQTSTVGLRGTYSTISAAIAQAVADGASNANPKTIFIRPGTYNENPVLNAGVNLSGFATDSNGSTTTGGGAVIINGNCTFTQAGTVSLYGIMLQTNGASFLSVTGSSASVVNLNNCSFSIMNATGITFSSSSSSSAINIGECFGNLTTTSLKMFAHTSAGVINITYSTLANLGQSTTASTISSGTVTIVRSTINFPITVSSTASIGLFQSVSDTSAINQICLTAGGSGLQIAQACIFSSGTNTTIAIPNTFSISDCIISSSNASAVINGVGTLQYTCLSLTNAKNLITTTQTGGTLPGSTFQNPSSGYLGEQIRGTLALGSAINCSNNTPVNIVTISLTPGVWDVTGVLCYHAAVAVTGTVYTASISTTSASVGTQGDNQTLNPTTPATSDSTLVVPAYRILVTATQNCYLVADAAFTVGTLTAYGRLSATRVG